MSRRKAQARQVVAEDVKATFRLMDFIIKTTEDSLSKGGLKFQDQLELQKIIRVSGEYREIVDELADQLQLVVTKESGPKELGKMNA